MTLLVTFKPSDNAPDKLKLPLTAPATLIFCGRCSPGINAFKSEFQLGLPL